MHLTLVRKTFTEESTIGVLSIDGKTECFTLEDKARPVKDTVLTSEVAFAEDVITADGASSVRRPKGRVHA